MSNLTSVTVTSGIPTAGTGTVSTIDALMADGGQATLGAKADAKSTATDTTAVSAISVWKQISASVQILAGAITSSIMAISIASGKVASGAFASGSISAGALADGADITQGAKADAASTATDTTAISAMSVWKQISASIQILAGAVGSSKVATKSASGDFADGSIATLGAKADGANTATDTTSVSAMSVFKQISASIQILAGSITSSIMAVSIASGKVVSGAFASGALADGAISTIGTKADGANTATDTTSVSGISIWKQISASIQVLAGAVGSSKMATKSASGDFADGSVVTLGAKADAASTATDTTAITAMSVFKQISKSVQAGSLAATGSDGSGSITTGGTAQTLFSGTTPANGFEIHNPDASEDLWISLSTTAVANGQGSINVAAGGGKYATPPGMRPFHAISVIGATTSHKFTAHQW